MLWDEENRLLSLSDNGYVSNYWYDASGERTVKESGDGEGVSVNGVLSGARTGTTNFTAYISPYLVVRNGGEYTKHIYMGGQRITSKVGNSGIFGSTSPVTTTELQAKYTAQTAGIKNRYDSLGVTYKGTPQSGGLISKNTSIATSSYFYHSDHLGSSSLITDQSGAIVQHLEYVPFGETFIDERKSQSSWTTPYLFSGKERDEETGLLYFGARYQDSKYGIWYSVDPLAEKYPNVSPYVYCLNNPVKFVDPDGKAVFLFATRLPMENGPMKSVISPATHTFIVVSGNDNVNHYYAYGGENGMNGKLMKAEYQQDIQVYSDYAEGMTNPNLKAAIVMPIPEGMTSEQFDQKVISTAESFGNNPNVTYVLTGGGETGGNCNTSTSTILSKSGVDEKTLSDTKSNIPGLVWGFGDIKPWTATEQKAAVQKENKILEEANKSIK